MNIDEHNETIKACRFCLMCRHACTVGNVTQRDTNLPRGKSIVLFAEQKNLLSWDKRAIEVMYECTNCHLCREWCVSEYDVAPVMMAARADIVDMGLAPAEVVLMKDHLNKYGNPYGEAQSQLEEWEKSLQKKPKADILLYFGCSTAFRRPEMAQSAYSILKHLDADMTILEDEPCCGEPYYILGYRNEAKNQAQRTLNRIRESGAHTVVTTCPTCTLSFRKSYEEWGVEVPKDIRFIHISEFIAEEMEEGRLKLNGSLQSSVTFHDPCSLGRELGVYDAPRKVINAVQGVEFREMRLNRNFSPCCGNGGGVQATNINIALGAGNNTGKVILETGAQILVTACPSCKQSLQKHVPGMEVLDIAELIAKVLK
ncbi:MAG TPA: hypothetical protein DIW44_11260 [Anaerolineaceae bacterium]|nr:hypothetical protein [Anaerolineaceae bacterium]